MIVLLLSIVKVNIMGRGVRKPVLWVFDIAILEPACTATETS